MDLIFVDGRAVAAAGDSLFAVTRASSRGVHLYDRRTGQVDTLGTGQLSSPFHLQETNGKWYVSDASEGQASIVVLSSEGTVERRVSVDTLASGPHQFAVLPDGRIVVEAPDSRLVVFHPGDTVATFAISEQSDRTGLLVAAGGGVLHAVPGKALTLYNANGNLRWRLPWPWYEGAYVADLAVDAHGRYHVVAGEQGRERFVVFSLSPTNGEILRWSVPGPYATFVVDRLGQIKPNTERRWVGG